MTEVTKATEPTCAWCRKAIEGEPARLYAFGHPFLTLCVECHTHGYQAAMGLVALGNSMISAKKTAKAKTGETTNGK
jgi:hypothetical protein